MKQTLLKIMIVSTIALLMPLMGNHFVSSWNWVWHDFLFAWVFWVIMATAITLMVKRFSKYKIIVGGLVFLCFAASWVLLATG
jgi:hypothetical protein